MKRQKRDLFLDLHEKLSRPDMQTGRTLLREQINGLDDAIGMRRWKSDDYQKAVSAIAMFDILGLYVEERFIKRSLVFKEWGWLYADVYFHARYVIQDRRNHGRDPWLHFQRLGEKALAKYPVPTVNSAGDPLHAEAPRDGGASLWHTSAERSSHRC
ncbi:hypothetical protein SCOCK_180139 [Actinacidiphila cocklensis]|uniref:Uncharacterized protein n=2 Tax=Actinacidiphila cocklensis TaxID=887465 RepID=A0A9W4E4N7_9ACTN|nr:hypothetical protein SCOCK_180139 [Actinacidiphila cocklensis]